MPGNGMCAVKRNNTIMANTNSKPLRTSLTRQICSNFSHIVEGQYYAVVDTDPPAFSIAILADAVANTL